MFYFMHLKILWADHRLHRLPEVYDTEKVKRHWLKWSLKIAITKKFITLPSTRWQDFLNLVIDVPRIAICHRTCIQSTSSLGLPKLAIHWHNLWESRVIHLYKNICNSSFCNVKETETEGNGPSIGEWLKKLRNMNAIILYYKK